MGVFDVLLKLLNALCGGQKAEEPPVDLPTQQPPRPHQQQQQQHQQQPHQQHQPPAQPPQSQWEQPKPHHQPHHETSPSPGPPSHAPEHQAHHKSRRGVNENLENQNNTYYVDLRERANRAGDEMARLSRESQAAYHAGDGARAKELSDESKRHRAEMESLNAEASEWIFKENNTDSEPGEVDLHGLYAREAITYADRSIEEARARGQSHIRLIVGKGMHSKGGASKLRPAIEELMQKHQLVASMDPHNAGVLVVDLGGASQGGPQVGSDEITRRLENDREECVIM
ncbi:DUF1771-domain-containing protein [Exidia glandulosa HHB12029]|uniref:DUF1771-domain-containing protein n=1 Tax=Exidia glandulosa HHB12029 TaxID=1314781 RepID=A0A165ECC0_EXIGL|nr:DUF1771-domain-containing protein [Exidia glandulosa HHB12029]